MKRTYTIAAGVVIALSLAAAATVSAHPGGGFGGMGMGPGMGMGMGPGMGGPMRGADAGAWASARMAQLKSDLKVTPAQESAWKAYESAMQQQAATMQAMRTQMQALMKNAQPGSAEFAVQRDAMIKQHDAGFQARDEALKGLYAVLTPEQRTIADRSAAPRGADGMSHRHSMR